jgi:hypothetical protein
VFHIPPPASTTPILSGAPPRIYSLNYLIYVFDHFSAGLGKVIKQSGVDFWVSLESLLVPAIVKRLFISSMCTFIGNITSYTLTTYGIYLLPNNYFEEEKLIS